MKSIVRAPRYGTYVPDIGTVCTAIGGRRAPCVYMYILAGVTRIVRIRRTRDASAVMLPVNTNISININKEIKGEYE